MCSTSDFLLNLDETINQDNVILAAQNYANEFYYTINHISRFISKNFTMVFYKNSSCIEQLNLNSTKIEYDSCIKQIKKDNNINDIIIVVIDIFTGNNPITSFGFFNSENGEKLDGTKSCSDKNVIMYEDIINVLNDPLALKLFIEQKINIFDLENEFYNDICFHFDSPNGKDATLKDRIKTFYPNITLCDQGCKNKGVNITSMKAECECKFQDLLSNDFFHNDIIGDNVLIQETLNNIFEMLSNLNLEVLSCYKDVFNYQYFKKNIGGFIIILLIIIQIICYIYYYLISNKHLIKCFYLLPEIFKNIKRNNNGPLITIYNPPKNGIKQAKLKDNKTVIIHRKKTINMKNRKENGKNSRINKTDKNTNPNYNKKSNKQKSCKNLDIKSNKSFSIFKKKKDKTKKININIKIKNYNKLLIKTNNNQDYSKDNLIKKNQKLNQLNKSKNIKTESIFKFKKEKEKEKEKYKKKQTKIYNNKLIKNDIDFNDIMKTSYEEMEYDDVIDDDKRTFCQYYWGKIKKNQMFINSFFITELIKPKSIKIIVFILNIDLYFLINGLFLSDSYISEIFNSKEEEEFFSFVPRSINRFTYSTLVGHIIKYIIQCFFIEEIKIKKILLKQEKFIITRYAIFELMKSMFKKIKILTIIDCIIILFSWYYISCLNNVYPHIIKEWFVSSLFLIIIIEILPFIVSFLETCIRYTSIKFESEKLFKLSRLFP